MGIFISKNSGVRMDSDDKGADATIRLLSVRNN